MSSSFDGTQIVLECTFTGRRDCRLAPGKCAFKYDLGGRQTRRHCGLRAPLSKLENSLLNGVLLQSV